MPRRATHIPLNIFLNGRLVGQLRKQSSGAIDFQYDDTWLAFDGALPISFSLPLREDRYIGEPVIAVFDNLLPDNDVIRHQLAERVRAEGDDAYSLLAAIGRDCVGALQFLPEGVEPESGGRVRGNRLTNKEIAEILNNLGRAPLGVTQDNEFRISIAGIQEKTALLYWKRAWYKPVGDTATTHILKPQIGRLSNGLDLYQSVENEHFCMSFLAALGLPTAKTKILDFNGKRVLALERFDRRWTKDKRLLRIPQEDCCQAMSVPPTRKYESSGGPGMQQILKFLRGSDDPEQDQKLFLQAQVAFWLLGATDGHAKNFSIFLGKGGRFHLTPLYDVMSAQPDLDAKQLSKNKMKMAMAVGANRHYVVDTVCLRHFIETAELSGMPAKVVTEFLEEIRAKVAPALEKTLSNLPGGFPAKIAQSIAKGVKKRVQNF
ncbi:MAG: type II toxin-antitoxin system HipA family toxin [Alphaproteobacteria bacterium]|nr:type II toxin-antitoxin system HipA family toxin [Alphaproteobacteria bacterium]